jgi:hypothetical protein
MGLTPFAQVTVTLPCASGVVPEFGATVVGKASAVPAIEVHPDTVVMLTAKGAVSVNGAELAICADCDKAPIATRPMSLRFLMVGTRPYW